MHCDLAGSFPHGACSSLRVGVCTDFLYKYGRVVSGKLEEDGFEVVEIDDDDAGSGALASLSTSTANSPTAKRRKRGSVAADDLE